MVLLALPQELLLDLQLALHRHWQRTLELMVPSWWFFPCLGDMDGFVDFFGRLSFLAGEDFQGFFEKNYPEPWGDHETHLTCAYF